tara:strand:+ start:359 stop:1144 length:786 start_codon:yes stop_codon:yes gene_type:complete
MTIQHKLITGADLHEPKDVAAAAANKVYVANGSGSGTWATLATASITDDAVTADKLANSINTAIAANTAKTTNATHSGEVTGATALTIANNAVTNAKMADNAIDTAELAAGAVETDKTNLPKGKFYFYNTGSPYSLSFASSTAKVAATTIASGYGNLVTEATSARLTYTGTPTTVVKLDFDVSIKQASGADRDIMISVHRNGTVIAGSQVVVTSVTGDLHQAAGSCFYNAATDDYFEIYAQNTGADGTMLFQKVALTLTAT